MGSVIGYQEAHGPVATFETDVAGKIKNLTVNINPVQSGTGGPSPDNVRPITGWTGAKVMRCGKNLLEPKFYDGFNYNPAVGNSVVTVSGIVDITDSVTKTGDTYTKSGPSWSVPMCMVFYVNRQLWGKTIKFSGTVEKISGYRSGYYIADVNNICIAKSGSMNEQPTWMIAIPNNSAYIVWYMNTSNAGTMMVTNPQLELGSTATEYEPYNGSTYDITFPSEAGTVYGGTLDVVNGELVVDRRYKNLNDPSKWISSTGTQDFAYRDNIDDRMIYSSSYEGLVCSAFPIRFASDGAYMRWTAAASTRVGIKNVTTAYTLTDIQQMAQDGKIAIVYTLATPITYQLTPQEIALLRGNNTIFADCGDTTISYFTN